MDAVPKSGLEPRERRIGALRLWRAMVITASTGYGGHQPDMPA